MSSLISLVCASMMLLRKGESFVAYGINNSGHIHTVCTSKCVHLSVVREGDVHVSRALEREIQQKSFLGAG